MPANEWQPTGARETHDRAELRRAAYKIAWARMNRSIDAANPFAAADNTRVAPEDERGEDRPSHHR
jgi:hypothetical protein